MYNVLITTFRHWPKHRVWVQGLVQACEEQDLRLETVDIDYSPEKPTLPRYQLEEFWKRRDRRLLQRYESLWDRMASADVLLHLGERNLHPDFVRTLPGFKVFYGVDDPEGSHEFSAGIAPAFDAVLYGNIAARFQYEKWGCRRISFIHHVNDPRDLPQPEEVPELLTRLRDIPIVFVGERHHPFRERRLNALVKAFPQARCYGRGWPAGFIDHDNMLDLYRRAQVGWNVHNSTGPINRRLYALLAFGVLQICDNKIGLGQLFKLGEEILGFDTIQEAIELTRYYLDHPNEAREIAAAGCRRYWAEYHVDAFWRRIAALLSHWVGKDLSQKVEEPIQIERPRLFSKNQLFAARFHYSQSKVLRKIRNTVGMGSVVVGRKLLNIANELMPETPAEEWCTDEGMCFRDYSFVNSNKRDDFGGDGAFLIRNRRVQWERIARSYHSKDSAAALSMPELRALAWAVASLVSPARRVLCIGSGAVLFAHYAAVAPSQQITCIASSDSLAEMLRPEQNKTAGRIDFVKDLPGDGRWELVVFMSMPAEICALRALVDFVTLRSRRGIFVFQTPWQPRDMQVDMTDVRQAEGTLQRPEISDVSSMYLLFTGRIPNIRIWRMRDPTVPWLEKADFGSDPQSQWRPLAVEVLGDQVKRHV